MRPGYIAIGIVLFFLWYIGWGITFGLSGVLALLGLIFVVGGLIEKKPGEISHPRENIMARCQYCNKLNPEDAEYCNSCGKKLINEK